MHHVLNDVALRAPRLGDVPFLQKMWNDPELAAISQPGRPVPVSDAVFERRILDGARGFFCGGDSDIEWIVSRRDDPQETPLGVAGLYAFDEHHGLAEIGVVLGEVDDRGHGIGLDTMVLLARVAFSVYDRHKVYAHVKGSNAAARGTCARIGLVEHGVFPEHRWVDGHREDLHVFGLLASDWHEGLERWRTNGVSSRRKALVP